MARSMRMSEEIVPPSGPLAEDGRYQRKSVILQRKSHEGNLGVVESRHERIGVVRRGWGGVERGYVRLRARRGCDRRGRPR